MGIFLVLLLLLILYKSKFRISGINEDYISVSSTLAIKGIFVFLIFFNHVTTYITINSIIDKPMDFLGKFLAQSIVVMFLFYSGYGIYEKLKKDKDNKYIKDFIKKRILNTYKNFIIGVLSFLLLDVILNKLTNYSITQILLSFIGWDSIGNSNWFMFYIIIEYIIVYISLYLFKNDNKKALITTFILTTVYILIMFNFKQSWWWNTAYCLPSGMLYSKYKSKIEEFLHNNINYYVTFLIVLLVYLILNYLYLKGIITPIYLVISVLFALLVVFVTMKIKISNKALIFFGTYSFWMYILQRIPMIVLKEYGLNKHIYIYVIVCFIITVILALMYSMVFDKKKNLEKK